jgi:hypothetical protein
MPKRAKSLSTSIEWWIISNAAFWSSTAMDYWRISFIHKRKRGRVILTTNRFNRRDDIFWLKVERKLLNHNSLDHFFRFKKKTTNSMSKKAGLGSRMEDLPQWNRQTIQPPLYSRQPRYSEFALYKTQIQRVHIVTCWSIILQQFWSR